MYILVIGTGKGNTKMINISAIAAAHNIDVAELAKQVSARGWDFSKLDANNSEEINFAVRLYTDYASDIASRIAKIESSRKAQQAAFAAKWETLTKAAQANPHQACKRCNGVGRIITYSHVMGGRCLRCEGTGVR